jgi:CRP-like cAMP-binding protein
MPKRETARTTFGEVPERPSNLAALEACTLLNALTERERAELADHSFMAYAVRGEMLWAAGSPSDVVGIVGAGFLKMTKYSPKGQEVAMELLGPGQCFGLLAAIEGRAFPLNAIAATNTWYLKIPTRILQPIYQASAGLKDQVVRAIGPRLRRAHDMMSRLSSGRVESRIAAVLLILADSYGLDTGTGVEIAVPLTRQDISEMAGTTVETTIRVMSRWQKDRVISTNNKHIAIIDPHSLAEAVQS